ncbi:MAG: YIP1 family protein [Acidobacteria bacterium]|jgi:hypothetical protein|nr:YIP1 family protein [Acidobacteriota bacterium]
MNGFINNVIGVITSPASAVAKAMAEKRWPAALVLVLLVTAICTYVTYPVTKVEQAKFIRDSEMAEKLSDQQLADLDKFTPTQRASGAVFSAVFAALVLVVGAFFVYLFFKVGGVEGLYVNYFSGVAQASVLDMVLGGILKSTLVMLKKTMMVHTGLTMFFPGLDFRSLNFILLSQFDFFSLWYLTALALGIAAFAKISLKKSLVITGMYFLFKSLVLVAVSFFTMKMMGM